jgi:predicted esterase
MLEGVGLGATRKEFSASLPRNTAEPSRAKRIAHIPVRVFHGAKDPAVPLEMSQKMVESLKKNGGNPKFTVYPEAGHDSWTAAYNTPEL